MLYKHWESKRGTTQVHCVVTKAGAVGRDSHFCLHYRIVRIVVIVLIVVIVPIVCH